MNETLSDANRRAIDHLQDRVDALEAEKDTLRERIDELEDLVVTDLDAMSYEQLTKRDKVRAIREHLGDEAESTPNGKASMTYREVWALFNGQPSPGHAYDLMRIAGDGDGYSYEEYDGDRTNRLTVNAKQAFHGANKAVTQSTP